MRSDSSINLSHEVRDDLGKLAESDLPIASVARIILEETCAEEAEKVALSD